jgi:formate-dependent nitrite reductase membrane component NrfD
MTDLYLIQPQVEVARWGWDIAIFLWLVGLSGMGTLAYYWLRKAPLAYMALATVILGLIVVFSHLTRWWNLPAAVFYALINFSFNLHSWMMLGVLFLSVQALLTLLLALHHFGPLRSRAQAGVGWAVALVAATDRFATSNLALGLVGAFGVLVTVYSGFLLTQAVGVPLWNTALLPILWVVSAGVAVLALIELFHLRGWIDEGVAKFGMKLALASDSLKLLMLFAFVYVGLSASSAGARAGAAELSSGALAPMLWIGVIGLGILVPMGVTAYTLTVRKNVMLIAFAAVLALAGGLLLRASVLLAGKFDPLLL